MKIKQITPDGSRVHFTSDATTFYLNREETRDILNYEGDFDVLSLPEVIHLELTDRCNLNCDYCYVDQNKRDELDTEEWKRIIDDLTDCPIFQLTFGGGEPFLRQDIFELAEYARERMNVAVTSNGTALPDDSRLSLFDQINISFHGDMEVLKSAVKHLSRFDVQLGINFLLDMRYLEDLPEIVDFSERNDLELLLLTYKPVNGDWENMLSPTTVQMIAEELAKYGTKIAVDMMTLRRCTGKDRFYTVGSNGDLFPCSFVRKPIGNLLESSLKEIIRQDDSELRCPYLLEERDEAIKQRIGTRIQPNCSEWSQVPSEDPRPELTRRIEETIREKELEDQRHEEVRE